jgi:septal ring factor EnvC (AmiA/AmiB activator)
MADTIGEFLHKKIKSKGLEDKQVAGFLNISPSTLRKTYPLEDMYISRLIEFCELLGEDIILEYYYSREPLKSLRKNETDKWGKEMAELKAALENKEKITQQLQEHINTQNELIALQKREIKRLEGNKEG